LENFLQLHGLRSYPIVQAIVEEAVNSLGENANIDVRNAEKQRWNIYVMERINIGRTSFTDHFLSTTPNGIVRPGDNNFGHLYSLFEAFAMAEPSNMRQKDYNCHHDMDRLQEYVENSLNALVNRQIINDNLKEEMLQSLGNYVHLSRNFSYISQHFGNKMARFILFWKMHKSALPEWFAFVKKGMLYMPNSCGVERLFSLLKRVITADKSNALDDYIKTAVYLCYKFKSDYSIIVDENNVNENLNNEINEIMDDASINDDDNSLGESGIDSDNDSENYW